MTFLSSIIVCFTQFHGHSHNQEYDVTYHEADMWTGTMEVLNHLSSVSAEFIKEFPAM